MIMDKCKAAVRQALMAFTAALDEYGFTPRQFLMALTLVLVLLSGFCVLAMGRADPVASLTLFPVEQQAQLHCPRDTIVWINLRSGVWHSKRDPWYAGTVNGAYICEQELDRVGKSVFARR
jgi:hypothetical protein